MKSNDDSTLPFVAISNKELRKAPPAPTTVECPHCNETHTVDIDGDEITLHSYKCGGHAYIVGINGKAMRN